MTLSLAPRPIGAAAMGRQWPDDLRRPLAARDAKFAAGIRAKDIVPGVSAAMIRLLVLIGFALIAMPDTAAAPGAWRSSSARPNTATHPRWRIR